MALKIKCPCCGEIIVSKFCKIGEVVKCKACWTEFAIPKDAQMVHEDSTLIEKAATIAKEQVERIGDSETQIAKGKRYPGIIQAIWLIIIFILLQLCLGLLATIIDLITGHHFYKEPIVISMIGLFSLGILLKIGFDKTRMSFSAVFPFKPISNSLLLPIVITIIGYMMIGGVVNIIISMAIPGVESFAKQFRQVLTQNIYAAFLLINITGPFIEELFFRGLILRGFLNRYKLSEAIMVSALLFAIYHLNIFQLVTAFFLGIVSAWWFVKTRSLVPSLFGHIVNNSLAFTLAIIMGLEPASKESPNGFVLLAIAGLGILVFALGIWLSIRMFKKMDNTTDSNLQNQSLF